MSDYDRCDAAYIFWNATKIYKQNTTSIRNRFSDGELEFIQQLFDNSIAAAVQLTELVDWSIGLDCVFAYDKLDTTEHGGIADKVLFRCTLQDSPERQTVQEMVLQHIVDREWPLSTAAKVLLLPKYAECPFPPEDKALGRFDLEVKYGTWGEHSYFAHSDWQQEVGNNDTRSSYWSWVFNKVQSWEPDQ